MNLRTPLRDTPLPVWLACIAAVAASLGAGFIIPGMPSADNLVKAVIVAAGAAAVMVTARDPRRILVLCAVAAPFSFTVTVAGFPLDTASLLLFVTGLALIGRLDAERVPAVVGIGAALMVAGYALATGAADDPALAAYGAARWIAVVTVLIAGAGVLRESPATRVAVARAVTIATPIVVLGALVQAAGVTVPPIGEPFEEHLDSTFGYYTNYAGFLALGSVVAIGCALHAARVRAPAWAVFSVISAVSGVVGIGLAVSRGGILALGVGLIVLLLLQVKRPAVALVGVAGVVAVLLVAFTLTPGTETAALKERLTTRQTSDIERRLIQTAGVTAATSHPLGLGYGGFRRYVRENVRATHTRAEVEHAHRTPVQVTIEGGWLAGAGFVLLFAGAFATSIRSAWRDVDPLSSGAAGALMGFVAQGWNDYLLVETASLLCVVAVLLIALTGRSGGEPRTG